ncbi:hypothetical protein DFR29_10211 [Tahibacter aquaticus]|uniref:Uncharacterized protein n=1 Tax=Tahibacter aquaticus TaxID=520092 RepID=A0A4R6Z6J6_9GAMM|nr:hypothetical protein [Tahibacter aquaticus]TDR47352.1 hypothetical protein DFR29_10211 [Tahibacter aquaticus]
MNETAKYRFLVKEGEPSRNGADDAPVFLSLEPADGELSVIKKGSLTMRLKPGTTVDEAQTLAQSIEKFVAVLSYQE